MPNSSVTNPLPGDQFHHNDRDQLSQECLKLRRQNAKLSHKVNAQQQKISHQTEELDALQHLKQLVMQAICHDLRTSVAGSRMVLEKLRHQIRDESQARLIDQLLIGNDRQLALIQALALDPNQNSNLCQPKPRPVDVGAIATATLQKLACDLQRHQISVLQQMPANLPLVLAEPSQLQQVFTHLVDNVIRHNPPGTVATLTATALATCPTTHQTWLQCTIQDNGVGIPTENRPCLFKPYLRCQHETRRTGIGLGLYQCRQIIQRFHGDITLSSQPGHGTLVQFTLPIVPQAQT